MACLTDGNFAKIEAAKLKIAIHNITGNEKFWGVFIFACSVPIREGLCSVCSYPALECSVLESGPLLRSISTLSCLQTQRMNWLLGCL
jgi:hypothetical protein